MLTLAVLGCPKYIAFGGTAQNSHTRYFRFILTLHSEYVMEMCFSFSLSRAFLAQTDQSPVIAGQPTPERHKSPATRANYEGKQF